MHAGVRLITDSSQKNDRLDAKTLARLARIDPELLSPIRHRSEQAQADLMVIRARLAGPLSEPLQKIIRSRQDSLMLRTNLSACAFRFGDRGGNLTDSTSKSATMFRNSAVNRGSRSWIK